MSPSDLPINTVIAVASVVYTAYTILRWLWRFVMHHIFDLDRYRH